MITDEQLNFFRQEGKRVRVIRDALPENDVLGLVVAWSDEEVVIRKSNRKVVKLRRSYQYLSLDPRPE